MIQSLLKYRFYEYKLKATESEPFKLSEETNEIVAGTIGELTRSEIFDKMKSGCALTDKEKTILKNRGF